MYYEKLKTSLEKELCKHFPDTKVSYSGNDFSINISRDLAECTFTVESEKHIALNGFFINHDTNKSIGICKLAFTSIINELNKEGWHTFSGEGHMDGCVVWPKFGFIPNVKDWNYIRSDIIGELVNNNHKSINDPQRNTLLKVCSISDPRAMWIISDSSFNQTLMKNRMARVELDLKDPFSCERFSSHAAIGQNTLEKISKNVACHLTNSNTFEFVKGM